MSGTRNWSETVPQHVELPSVRDWASEVRGRALSLSPSDEALRSIVEVNGSEVEHGDLGILSSPQGRAFANAIWAADWAAYDSEADRVDYARLCWVISTYPAGFTLYLHPSNQGILPIGYSGFYPITKANYEYLVGGAPDFAHRGQAVPVQEASAARYLYVFNYSMVAPLRRSTATRRLLLTLRDQLDTTARAGLCAITVSPEGSRVAARFGLHRRATVSIPGSLEEEHVYGCNDSR